MKQDLLEGYQRNVLETFPQPLSYTALQNGFLKATSLKDLRHLPSSKQTRQKHSRTRSPFSRLSETIKGMGFAKGNLRNGSISSNSGEGSLSQKQSTEKETMKSILKNSEQFSNLRRNSQDDSGEKSTKRKPEHLTFRKRPRRLTSRATSPTKQTINLNFQEDGCSSPFQSMVKEHLNSHDRTRVSSLPDAFFGNDNRMKTTKIRGYGEIGIGFLEEDEEQGQYGNEIPKCLDFSPTSQPTHTKRSSVLLLSDHNTIEWELIELNKLLDKETLKASAAIPDDEGMTILHRAVQNGFVNLAKFLINSGVSTEMRDGEGRTALLLALERGNYDCAELLVRLGANVNCMRKGGSTILHRMVQEADYRAVQFLVRHGADLNLEDDKGWPALHYALKRKDLKSAALLMTHGVDIHRYTEKRIQEYSMSMEIVNIAKVRMDTLKAVNNEMTPALEVTII